MQQNGAEVSAAILRVDGDTGLLTGEYRDGQIHAEPFFGRAPVADDLALQPDGSLQVVQNGKTLTAVRSSGSPCQRLACARRPDAAHRR